MKATANRRLIPINNKEAKQVAANIAEFAMMLKQSWVMDRSLNLLIRDKTSKKSIEDLLPHQAYHFVGNDLLKFDMDIIPNIGVMPKYGTQEYYNWMARIRWKKPVHVEVQLTEVMEFIPLDNSLDDSSIEEIIPARDSTGARYSREKSMLLLFMPSWIRIGEWTKKILEKVFYTLLVHELTHAMDPDLRDHDRPYGQQKHEIRAYARNIFEEMAYLIKSSKPSGHDQSQSAIFWDTLSRSGIWSQTKSMYGEEGQRKILEYVYTELVNEGWL